MLQKWKRPPRVPMWLTATISNIETLRHWWSRNAPSLFVSEFQWLDHGWTWRPRLLLAFLQIGTMGRRHSPPIGNGHDRSCMNHDETKTGFLIMICSSANNIIHLSMINWSLWGWWEVSYIGWGNCHFDDHGHGDDGDGAQDCLGLRLGEECRERKPGQMICGCSMIGRSKNNVENYQIMKTENNWII